MDPAIPKTMKAAAIERFGGPEVLKVRELPVPEPGPDEILIQVESAGVGVWDPWLREGGMAERRQRFPLVIGSDGAGRVVAVGTRVRRFRPGDRVYAYAWQNPKGGFYAEYAAVKAEVAAKIPENLSDEEAGALAVDGLVALEGLTDHLGLRRGQTVLIVGASGGVGHLAVQLGKRIGARVVGVASGQDGVELVKRLGADHAFEGHAKDLAGRVAELVPEGFDCALVLAGGPSVSALLSRVKRGGRIAYPHGVEPEPKAPAGVTLIDFDGTPSPRAYERLNRLIALGPFHVELGGVFPLEKVAQAHRQVEKHHLGKLALRVHA